MAASCRERREEATAQPNEAQATASAKNWRRTAVASCVPLTPTFLRCLSARRPRRRRTEQSRAGSRSAENAAMRGQCADASLHRGTPFEASTLRLLVLCLSAPRAASALPTQSKAKHSGPTKKAPKNCSPRWRGRAGRAVRNAAKRAARGAHATGAGFAAALGEHAYTTVRRRQLIRLCFDLLLSLAAVARTQVLCRGSE